MATEFNARTHPLSERTIVALRPAVQPAAWVKEVQRVRVSANLRDLIKAARTEARQTSIRIAYMQ